MLKNRLSLIEKEIAAVLPEKADTEWFEPLCGATGSDHELSTIDQFCDPARDLLHRGGKRWRPLLMVLLAEILGGEPSAAVAYKAAPLVELPHNGSLIIDDIEDGSNMRRGEPAVHRRYGTDISINAGNLLYFLPTTCIDQLAVSNELKLHIYRIYSKYMRRVHFGQGFDISWHRRSSYFPDEQSYRLMCRLKTGCLAGMASEIGAAAGGAGERQVTLLGENAEELGVAFQIMDDVVNLETGNPGKMRGDDILEGKKSLPMILLVTHNPQHLGKLASLLEQARLSDSEQESSQGLIEEVIEMVESSGALKEAKKTAAAIYEQVTQRFEQMLPACSTTDELFELLEIMK